jgi:5'-3' exonuclease
MGIDVIVAPYEADAQLTYLNISHIADYVITEDSDLVLFGCHHVRSNTSTNDSLLFEMKTKRKTKAQIVSRFYLNWMTMVMENYSIVPNSI